MTQVNSHPLRVAIRATQLAILLIASACASGGELSPAEARNGVASGEQHYLYVAVPGVRRYLEFGGHGLLVFDIDNNHRFVKRIPVAGLLRKEATFPDVTPPGQPSNVKGIVASAATNSVYISNLETMQRVDLGTDRVVWEHEYEGGVDRMAISPDGRVIYAPAMEGEQWNVIDAETGSVITALDSIISGSHNTIFSLDGSRVYMAGLRSRTLAVLDPRTNAVVKQVGPFGGPIRPFTINGAQTLAYANVNGLLGFEIADLRTGQLLHRIDVTQQGFEAIQPLRHGVFSHGVGLTPDEKEVWVVDGANERIHIYDNTVMPPRYVESIKLRSQPGWITFSMDGRYAYPPTGEVIDVASRRVVAQLTDENGAIVQSEKLVEAFLRDGKIVRVGDQFGLGRVTN